MAVMRKDLKIPKTEKLMLKIIENEKYYLLG